MITIEQLNKNIGESIAKGSDSARPIKVPIGVNNLMVPDGSLYPLTEKPEVTIEFMMRIKSLLKSLGTLSGKRNEEVVKKARSYFRGNFSNSEVVGDFTPFNNPFIHYINISIPHMPVEMRQNLYYSEEDNTACIYVDPFTVYEVKMPSAVKVIMEKLKAEIEAGGGTVKSSYITLRVFDDVTRRWQEEMQQKKIKARSIRQEKKEKKTNVLNSTSTSR